MKLIKIEVSIRCILMFFTDTRYVVNLGCIDSLLLVPTPHRVKMLNDQNAHKCELSIRFNSNFIHPNISIYTRSGAKKKIISCKCCRHSPLSIKKTKAISNSKENQSPHFCCGLPIEHQKITTFRLSACLEFPHQLTNSQKIIDVN